MTYLHRVLLITMALIVWTSCAAFGLHSLLHLRDPAPNPARALPPAR